MLDDPVGGSRQVCFGDDFVMLFAYKDDAHLLLAVLGKRLEKYGLELHSDRTSMVDFRYKPKLAKDTDEDVLATNFNFLGSTHIWVKSGRGWPVVRQQTAKDRLARAVKAVNQQCQKMRHWSVRDQHQKLHPMLKGHFAYFGISRNSKCLSNLKWLAERCWRKWLSCRSSKSNIPWVAFKEILKRFSLPQARIVHHYTENTCANLYYEEPDALIGFVRVCEGWGRRRPHLLGSPHVVALFRYASKRHDRESAARPNRPGTPDCDQTPR